MRTTNYCCDRCGSPVLEGRSVLEVKAGELAKRHDEPWIDLCGSCTDRFVDWLRTGKEGVQNGLGATMGGLAVETSRSQPADADSDPGGANVIEWNGQEFLDEIDRRIDA